MGKITKDGSIKEYSDFANSAMILGEDGVTRVSASNPLATTATISGDVNVDSTTVDTSGYIGKASGTNADFTTAYATATTLTCASLPTDVASLTADDVASIVQIATNGSVTNTYSRDDITITASGTDPTTLTVTGASFGATDTFVVYTNIAKPTSATTQYTAETTVPTAVADGATIDAWSDEYGRPIGKSDNLSLGATDVNDVSPALLQTLKTTGITQLTAPGDTSTSNVSNFGVYGYSITVASVDTTVVVQLEGSIDETNYATLPLDNTAMTWLAITNNVAAITVDGTYILYSSAPVVDVKLSFDSETGGEAATIDADFFARRI